MSQLQSVVLHKIPTWQKLAAPYEMCGRCNAMHAYVYMEGPEIMHVLAR